MTSHNQRPRQYDDEDMDSILSSILSGKAAAPARSISAPPKSKLPTPPRVKSATPQTRTTTTSAPTTPTYRPRAKSRQSNNKPKKPLLALSATILGVALFVALVVPAAIDTFGPSPFPREAIQKVDYPLLYPGKTPKGFSVDGSSVSQASDVTLYTIKDAAGHMINVSLQPQPNGLNLKPLFENMTSVRKIEAPAGDTTIGISPDNMLTAHVLTGSVWVIMRTPADTISEGEFEQMIKTLKQG